jgi:hypothetical protein
MQQITNQADNFSGNHTIEPKVIEQVDIHVSEHWGVHWDERETVRDFLQNFYDANNTNEIKIKIDKKTVQISAPAQFNYNELLYMRTTKANNPDAIGQYGEGFKASLLNAMRNWDCNVEMYVGNRKLRFYFKDKEFGETSSRIIMCEVSEIYPVQGTRLVVKNCSSRLITEFQFGLKHFYYKQNPLLGNCIINDCYDDIQIYESTEKNCGYLFYGKLIRSKLNLPMVIVCNKKYKRIDDKIKFDRDRKAFTQDVKESLLKYIFLTLKDIEIDNLLLHVKDFWIKGDNELAIIAETRWTNRWDGDIYLNKIFPDNYYAKESYLRISDKDNQLINPLIQNVADEYRKANYNCCPRYMSRFGMKTPDYIAKQRKIEKQKNISHLYSRDLTFWEKQGVNLLADFIKNLSPDLFKTYKNAVYSIGENDEVIGELKIKRDYTKQHIFLNKIFFTFPFSDALAIFLHEWAHLYGGDGGRSFSDALTGFISLILKNEKALEELKTYADLWKEISVNVINERKDSASNLNISELFDNLPKEKIKEILMSIPQEKCFKLLERNGVV